MAADFKSGLGVARNDKGSNYRISKWERGEMGEAFSRENFILELIKTVVIVVGVVLTVSEFVIKDRERQSEIRRNTMDLIRADFGSELLTARMEGFQQILTKYRADGTVSRDDAVVLEKTLIPQFQVLVSWEVCMAAGLCDEKIGKEYICKRAEGYKKISDAALKALGASDDEENANYKKLLTRCSMK
ncbi:hypothetical protein [Rhizobium ruizarguesonis]|uniref:hypothetical protein n=1 Tax=Rhizobium ruizarguesonis TaxID=2081791 RepID=UPI00102F337C|nr:hypothetical protein [Rhizobium ruizarguesonis]TBE18857.1 hypothetical protein ELH05_31400 [Rhizobium ruizarguesonis]WSH25273.1 hypothetical protein U8Q07_35060 [Rhizobium ruizarguesonis]WSH37612.1 hypothetical protein U8P70_31430 [Rhizobium ruizarguesonis]